MEIVTFSSKAIPPIPLKKIRTFAILDRSSRHSTRSTNSGDGVPGFIFFNTRIHNDQTSAKYLNSA